MSLRDDLVKLAYTNPDLRPTILPLVVAKIANGDPQINLFTRTIRLAHAQPDLRPHLLPLLQVHAKEEAKKEKKDENEPGFFSKVKKFFKGPSQIEQLKDDLPDKDRKMGAKEAEAFANHLTERLIKDVADGVGEGVADQFEEQEYEPDVDDYEWFLKEFGDKKVPSAMNALDDRMLSKSILPFLTSRGAADAGIDVATFFKYFREVRRTFFTLGGYGAVLAGKSIYKALKKAGEKAAKKLGLNSKQKKALGQLEGDEESKDRGMYASLISLRELSNNYKQSLKELEKMGERPGYWSLWWKKLGPELKDLSLPSKRQIKRELSEWDDREDENEYRQNVLASFFKEALENTSKSERAREKHTGDILRFPQNRDEIANFIKEQVKAALEGKESAKPDTIEVGKDLNVKNVLSAVKKGILAQMPAVKKEIDDTFEGHPEARKAVAAKIDDAAVDKRVESFLIPDVSGAIRGSKIKTVPQDYWMGIIPRQFGPDVAKIVKEKFKREDTLREQQKEEAEKERHKQVQQREQRHEKFYEEHKDQLFKKPSTGREVHILTLLRSDDPADKREYQKIYDEWKKKQESSKKKASPLYRALVKLAYEQPDVRGDLIPLLVDERPPVIPAIITPDDMRHRIDEAIKSKKPPQGVTTLRYGGPFGRLRRKRDPEECERQEDGKERQGFGIILPPPKQMAPKAPVRPPILKNR